MSRRGVDHKLSDALLNTHKEVISSTPHHRFG
jgi:hypothetical protein